MDPRPVTWVLEAVGSGVNGCACNTTTGRVSGVSTDSRVVKEGDLYIALEGDKFDGHDFVGAAFARGAAAALISKNIDDLGGVRDRAVIRVSDTRKALARLAAAHRRTLDTEIIAVTGSNGKTTVKDLVAHLLAGQGRVAKAPKSFNNNIGLPLTILAMDRETRFGVVEMGTNAPGEIAELCRIAAPDCGIVTNVGPAHLEGLGGIMGVAEEKGALVEALPESGMAFLNYEDYHCREMVRLANCRAATFAFDPSADIWGLKRRRVPGGVSFYLYGKMEVSMNVPGLHNAMNALAAAGVAMRYEVPPSEIRDRLASFELPEMRLRQRQIGGVTLINDAYNANPASVTAAIEELRSQPTGGRRILILGDMFELGGHSDQLHRKMGRSAARAGINQVWAVGRNASEVGRGLASVSRWKGQFHPSPTTDDAVGSIPFDLAPGDVVLVKGSRRMRLERVHDRIVEKLGGR